MLLSLMVILDWFLVWVEFGVGVGVEYHHLNSINSKHPPTIYYYKSVYVQL